MTSPRRAAGAVEPALAAFDSGKIHEALAALEALRDAAYARGDAVSLDELADTVDALLPRLRGDDHRWFTLLLNSIEEQLRELTGEPEPDTAQPLAAGLLGFLGLREPGRRQTGRHASAWCPTCETQRLGVRQPASHGLHLALSVLSGGLWLPVWFVLANKATTHTFHCTVCGSPITTTEEIVPVTTGEG